MKVFLSINLEYKVVDTQKKMKSDGSRPHGSGRVDLHLSVKGLARKTKTRTVLVLSAICQEDQVTQTKGTSPETPVSLIHANSEAEFSESLSLKFWFF